MNAQPDSLQQSFLYAFSEIDAERTGVITHYDLREFASQSGLPESFTNVSLLNTIKS